MKKRDRRKPDVVSVTEMPDGTRVEETKSWTDTFGSDPVWLQNLYEYTYLHNQVLRHETDRAAAVLAAAYLDVILEQLLRSNLVAGKSATALLDGDRPLAPFSARVHAAHALGLIANDTYEDLHRLRKIRNEFAHRVDAHSFEQDPFAQWIREFELLKRWPPQKHSVREAFLFASITLATDVCRAGMAVVQRQTPVAAARPVAAPAE